LVEQAHLVKEWAARQGFDACGIAAAAPIDPEDRLGAWLNGGYHADMAWMAETKAVRQDVTLKLPGARSVVVVARNYYAPRPERMPNTGRVSRYAWGRDYHNVLRKPLRRLAEAIRGLEPGAACYCCIDAGPVLERAWAARAGLGWIGKNGLVLRPDLGSWFFLGVILTTVELAPDAPMADQCGDCRRCIDACPTGAIVEERVVDAGRCISYHTIENRRDIPGDIAPLIGDWLFGCDICQEVCPWNRETPVTSQGDFHPREGHADPDLDRLAAMDEAAFREAFTGTPIRRAGHAGMLRNVAIVRENRRTACEKASRPWSEEAEDKGRPVP